MGKWIVSDEWKAYKRACAAVKLAECDIDAAKSRHGERETELNFVRLRRAQSKGREAQELRSSTFEAWEQTSRARVRDLETLNL